MRVKSSVQKSDQKKDKINVVVTTVPRTIQTTTTTTTTTRTNNDTSNSNSNCEYTITFQPGPIGMKLEPILESSQGQEIGCRVLEFVGGELSQAKRSGKITPGDVLLQVNHTNVVSWAYPQVIRFLKMLPTTQPKRLTFKSLPTTTSSKEQQQLLTNHVLTNLMHTTTRSTSSTTQEENSVFSPSKVKALSKAHNNNGDTTGYSWESNNDDHDDDTTAVTPLRILQNRQAQPPPPFTTLAIASRMSTKLAQAVMVGGHSTKDINQAVQLKLQLLTELSHAKINIDRKDQETTKMETIIQNLVTKLDVTDKDKESLHLQVQSLREAKTRLEQLFEDTTVKQDIAMEEQRNRFDTEQQTLVQHNTDLSNQVEQLQRDKTQANNDIKAARGEIMQQATEYAVAMDTKVQQLQHILAQQKATIEQTQHEFKESREKYSEDTKVKDSLLSNSKARSAHLESVVAEHEASLEQAQHDLQELSKAREEDKKVKDSLVSNTKAQSALLETELQQTKEANDKLNKTKHDLKVALEATITQLESSIKTVDRLELAVDQEKATRLQGEAAAQQLSAAQETAMSELEAQKKVVQSQHEDFQEKSCREATMMRTNLEAAVSHQEKLRMETESQLQRQVEAQVIAVSEMELEKVALCSELAIRGEELIKVHASLSDTQAELAFQTDLVATQRREQEITTAAEHTAELLETQTKNQLAQAELEKMRTTAQEKLRMETEFQLQSQAQEKLRMKAESQLQSQISAQTIAMAEMESEKVVMGRELITLNEELEKVHASLSETKADRLHQISDLIHAEGRQGQLLVSVDELKQQVSDAHLERQQGNILIENLRQECSKKEEELLKLATTTQARETELTHKLDGLQLEEKSWLTEKSALEGELDKKIEQMVDAQQRQFECEALLAEKEADFATAVKEDRWKFFTDLQQVLAEKKIDLSESEETGAALKQNHAELMHDLATFQVLLDAVRDEDGDTSTVSSTKATEPQFAGSDRSSIDNRASTQTEMPVAKELLLQAQLEESSISRAATALGAMKRSGGVHETTQALSKTQGELVGDSLRNKDLQARLGELEDFLRDSLKENQTLGEEARTLRSQLSASTSNCKALSTDLSHYWEEMVTLQTCDKKHSIELKKIRDQQQEADVQSEVRAKVIDTLQSRLTSDLDDYKATQSAHVEDVESHMHTLEQEIAKVVQANEILEHALHETKMALIDSEQVVADLRASSQESVTRLETMSSELDDMTAVRGNAELKLLEVQSALGAAFMENDLLQARLRAAEEEMLLPDSQSKTELATSKRLQEEIGAVCKERDDLYLSSTEKEESYNALKKDFNTAVEEKAELYLSYEKEMRKAEELRKSLKTMQSQVNEKEALNLEAWSEMQSLKAKLHQQAVALDKAEDRKEKLAGKLLKKEKTKHEELLQLLKTLQLQMDERELLHRETSSDLRRCKAKLDHQSTRIEELDDELHAVTDERVELERLYSEESTKSAELQQSVQNQMQAKDSCLQDLKEQLAGNLVQSGDLQGVLKNEKTKHEELLQSLMTLQLQMDEKDLLHRETSSDLVSCTAKLEHQSTRIEELDDELRATTDERVELEHLYSEESAKSAELQQSVHLMQNQMEAKDSCLQDLKEQLAGNLVQSGDLQGVLKNEKTKHEELLQSLMTLQLQMDEKDLLHRETSSDLVSCTAKLEHQSTRIEELDDELRATTDERVELEHLYSEESAKSAELQQSVHLMQNQMQAKDTSLQENLAELEHLDLMVKTTEHRIAVLETELRDKTAELESTQFELEAENTDMKEFVLSLEIECRTQRAAFNDMKRQIEQLHQDLGEAEHEAELLADEVLRCRRESEQAEKAKDMLQSELETMQRTVEDMDEASDFLQKRVFELENLINANKIELAEFADGDTSSDIDSLPFTPLQNQILEERTKRLTTKASELTSQRKAVSVGTASPANKQELEKSLRKSAAGLLIENVLHNREKAVLGSAFRQWSTSTNTIRAVSHHVHVAEAMNQQLQTTRSKLAALKSHLKSKRGER